MRYKIMSTGKKKKTINLKLAKAKVAYFMDKHLGKAHPAPFFGGIGIGFVGALGAVIALPLLSPLALIGVPLALGFGLSFGAAIFENQQDKKEYKSSSILNLASITSHHVKGDAYSIRLVDGLQASMNGISTSNELSQNEEETLSFLFNEAQSIIDKNLEVEGGVFNFTRKIVEHVPATDKRPDLMREIVTHQPITAKRFSRSNVC